MSYFCNQLIQTFVVVWIVVCGRIRVAAPARVVALVGCACLMFWAMAGDCAGQPAPTAPAKLSGSGRPTSTLAPGKQAAQGHESEQETIAKCLVDLQQSDTKLRRRAVLVLGKYNVPKAQMAIIACLQDSDDTVRQSALVALSECRRVPPAAHKPIIALLADRNVHIRRIASSLLRDVLRTRRFVNAFPVKFGRRPAVSGLDAETKACLNLALEDDDVTVRKNILSLHAVMGHFFKEESLIKCFAHADREIRILALRAYGVTNLAAPGRTDPLVALLHDKEEPVRLEVVKLLGRAGKQGLPLLRDVARDPAPVVRSRAIQQLARQADDGAFALLAAAVEDEQMPLEERRLLVRHLRFYPTKERAALMKFSSVGSDSVRAEVVRRLGALVKDDPLPRFFVQLLSDESAEIRKAATGGVLRRARQLRAEDIAQLVSSDYVDVRRMALPLVFQLPAEQAAQFIADCMLDDDVGIRCAAIRFAGQRAVPNWQLFMRQSLKDPSLEIQRAAADALLRRQDPQSRQILAEYLQSQPNPDLAAYVQRQMKRPRKRAASIRRALPAKRAVPRRK